jgi:UDP-4-amino-4,6-dideoxy-N-acetyl-beta-L-altrosamine transaminase
MIPYGKHEITQEDIDAVSNLLKNDFLTQGNTVPKFEKKLELYSGADYCVAVNSATSALHIACLSLGLSSGDIVWTSPITFVASANCAIYCGASVDFVDIELSTALIDVKKLEVKLIAAKKIGKLPKIVIPVHLAGQSCDMNSIHRLSKQYGFSIIEDASHAIGSSYKGNKVGSCKFSDITIFSFHPVKIITSGEGGAAITNNTELFSKMKLLRSHGINKDSEHFIFQKEYPWHYEQIELGFNYRLTDIQAALGISQLNRVDSYVKKRQEIAVWYDINLEGLPLIPLRCDHKKGSSYHLYVVRIKSKNTSHIDIHKYLIDKGIAVNMHYMPVYKHPFFKSNLYLEEAEEYYKTAISLPIFPTIKMTDLKYIVDTLKNYFA